MKKNGVMTMIKRYFGGTSLFSVMFLLTTAANAQQLTVTGQVTAASTGQALPGVNISIVGESGGAVTNVEGIYELVVSSDATLRFSFIGFETQLVPVDGREVIDVELAESTELLDELIVTGYGTVSRRELSSAVSQVSGEQLAQSVTTHDPLAMLEGRMAGIVVSQSSGQPGLNASVTIRGRGSINAGTGPLYVVDGVIGGRSAVSPLDIATITVLKDAAAALYGARAANGVVVITTKRGIPNQTRIDVRSSVGINTTLHGNESWMNSQELYDFHQNMGNAENGPFYNRSELLDIDTNWRDVGFDTGVTQTYHAAVSGGDEQTTFYISGNYYDEEGTSIETNFHEMTGRIKLRHNFNEDFQIFTQLAGTYSEQNSVVTGAPYTMLDFARRALPWDTPWNEDGSVRKGTEPDWYTRDSENPLHGMQWNTDVEKETYFSGDIRLQYDIVDWAYLTSTNRFAFSEDFEEVYLDSRSLPGAENNGEIEQEFGRSTSVYTSNILHLDRAWETQSLGGLIGVEYQQSRGIDSEITGGGFAPGMRILDAAATPVEVGGGIGESAFASVLAQAEYEYDGRYIVTLSYRMDGSSRFGENNRWGSFYSAGLLWNLSNESFMDNWTSIDHLALRASYGTTGNASIGNYEAQGLYEYTSSYIGVPASFPSRVPNPNLTWEVAQTINFGVDVDIWNRINMSLDVYQRDNVDLLQEVTLPGTSGIDERIQNVGRVRNRGLEIEITTTNIQQPSFSWTTSFTIATNRNRVLELYNGQPIDAGGDQRIMEGEDINTYWLRHWHGVDPANGAPLWEVVTRNDAGEIVNVEITDDYGTANPQKAGVSTPDYYGGIRNMIQYRNFTLSAFFTYSVGGLGYYDIGIDFGAYMTTNFRHLRPGESYWEEPGDIAHFPQNIVYGNNSGHLESTLFLYDRSYLRLRNVRLTYDLPLDTNDILPIAS